jgi:hypothetical protein
MTCALYEVFIAVLLRVENRKFNRQALQWKLLNLCVNPIDQPRKNQADWLVL